MNPVLVQIDLVRLISWQAKDQYGLSAIHDAAVFIQRNYPEGKLIRVANSLFTAVDDRWAHTELTTLEFEIATELIGWCSQWSEIQERGIWIQRLVPVDDWGQAC